MKSNYISFKNFKAVLMIAVAFSLSSCEKYVTIDVSPDKLTTEGAFATDASATSVIANIYAYYPTTYIETYFTYLGGISSDELQYTGTTGDIQQFDQSAVPSTSGTNESYLWTYPYQVIREANMAIEGITNSATISVAAKNQLLGEALFFRAFVHFNLVNFLGDVPLVTSSSEFENAVLPRTGSSTVYTQIIADLKQAQSTLPEAYAGTAARKVRVNKWAATALLARVYLYTKDYTNAEAEATKVIGSGVYNMAALSNTFINTSSETILQFATLYGYSAFGSSFRTSSSTETVAPPAYVLQPDFMKSFEKSDNRKTSWVDSTTYSAVKYYRINKYKLLSGTAGNEFNVILRLAEQYLIRAEARAQQGNLSGAQEDLNVVRTRAGLAETTAATQPDILTAIANERKVEFFGEFAHRWFDLKRTGKVDEVMSALRSNWKSTAALMPIPYNQIIINDKLTQNPGY